jgi:Cupin-like domain
MLENSNCDYSAEGCALRKLESILKLRTELRALRTTQLNIVRRRTLTSADFLNTYYSANMPVVVFDLFHDCRARSLWTPQYLSRTFGDQTVEVMMSRATDPTYEMNYGAHRELVRFSDYIKILESGGETNDYYLVANNHLLENPAFASLYSDFDWPPYLDPSIRDKGVFFWFGPAGTITPLHHDECNILLAQIRGRKLVKLISPDFTPRLYNRVGCFSEVDAENPDFKRHPKFDGIDVYNVILHPGEALFIPVAWWHYVRSLDLTISLSFSNFIYPNNYRISRPDRSPSE